MPVKLRFRRLALLLVIPALIFGASCAKKAIQPDAGEGIYSDQGAGQLPSDRERVRRQPTDEERLRQQREDRLREDELRTEAGRREMLTDQSRLEESDIYFSFDSAALSPQAQNILRQKGEWLRQYSNSIVVIEGHCDERGTNEYNLALGDRRAQSAKNFLMNLGIPASRLITISYGEERPLNPGHTEMAWAQNRRAHFVVQ